jgi:Chaperone of endosialidase
MNPSIQLKATPSLLITVALLGFALLPGAQAVVPPPDGGYPGFNTAEGQNALFSLTTGSANTAVGWFSLFSNTGGSFNTAAGAGALLFNAAEHNSALGAAALLNNTTGFNNTATGTGALSSNTIGTENTANGAFALVSNITGIANTAVGNNALFASTGGFNTALGASAGIGVTTASNVIVIGTNFFGANVNNSCFINNIRDTTTANNNAIPVLIDSAGQLGTQSSSIRFKKEIKPMDTTSESILSLKPVTFHYKSDKTNRPEFGLIAEEVAKVDPDLVVRDASGEIYTVRYDAVNAMLLNEFLKEHRKVEKLEATVLEQQKQIKALTAGLEKVSARLEMNKAPRVVENTY